MTDVVIKTAGDAVANHTSTNTKPAGGHQCNWVIYMVYAVALVSVWFVIYPFFHPADHHCDTTGYRLTFCDVQRHKTNQLVYCDVGTPSGRCTVYSCGISHSGNHSCHYIDGRDNCESLGFGNTSDICFNWNLSVLVMLGFGLAVAGISPLLYWCFLNKY